MANESEQRPIWQQVVKRQTVPCKACNGQGGHVHPVPQDLQRWRYLHGLSQKVFAAEIVNPNTGRAPHWTLIANVENGKAPCPAWLEEEYRLMPEREWPAPGSPKKFETQKRLAEERFAQEGS